MGGVINSNLYSCFSRHFPAPSAVLLTTESGQPFTYGDAEQRSARVANALVELGLEAGDRVSVQVKGGNVFAGYWLLATGICRTKPRRILPRTAFLSLATRARG